MAVMPPDPLTERPPEDQYCDLVLNGGVASGVVYPWALLELARHYRFRNIGGNSVGAMAATIAAAAEYGRCYGVEQAFEPLRQMPLRLAETQGSAQETKLLRLFQPSPEVRRPFDLFIALVRWTTRQRPHQEARTPPFHCPEGPSCSTRDALDCTCLATRPPPPQAEAPRGPRVLSSADLLKQVAAMYQVTPLLKAFGVLWLLAAPALAWLLLHQASPCVRGAVDAVCLGYSAGALSTWLTVVGLGILGSVALALLVGTRHLIADLNALEKNFYGMCTGKGQAPGEEGLVEWLHRGVQLSAGREEHDKPLTFADLWAAPRQGRQGPQPRADGTAPDDPGIDLQMFASNITQGRPVRLPLNDPNTRLFYLPEEWSRYFPAYLMEALERASAPYMPANRSDPSPTGPAPSREDGGPVNFTREELALMHHLRELPAAGMPIVVAARLSLCFPLLFSCVPVYAVDYEAPLSERRLRRCLLSDGGLCTNFPVHLFDAAHPRWPTFALLLDRRLRRFRHQLFWLPEKHLEGRGDNWQRFVPGAEDEPDPEDSLLGRIGGLVGGILLTMKDWNDRVTGRMPQVRNRMIRLALQDGEGQLNLAMPAETMLRMANDYGTLAGKALVCRFAPRRDGPSRAWREHLYVRAQVELRGLRNHLRRYTEATTATGSSVPLQALFAEAVNQPPLASSDNRPDPTAARLKIDQAEALAHAVQAVQDLERELDRCAPDFGPYRPVPMPEVRLRPPL